jgi:putative acetyltransferase
MSATTSDVQIHVDNLTGPEIARLMEEHLQSMKELDRQHGEIKSMRTVTAHLRKGVAARLLEHMIEEARRRAYRRLSLETGSMAAFAPARELYARFGFERCGPFGDYVMDPYSTFMTKEL